MLQNKVMSQIRRKKGMEKNNASEIPCENQRYRRLAEHLGVLDSEEEKECRFKGVDSEKYGKSDFLNRYIMKRKIPFFQEIYLLIKIKNLIYMVQ